MAIIKDFETPQGINAQYHKVIKGEFNVSTETVEIVLAVFASAEARDAGKSVLWHEYVRIPFADLSEDPRIALYALLSNSDKSYLQGGESDLAISATPAENLPVQ